MQGRLVVGRVTTFPRHRRALFDIIICRLALRSSKRRRFRHGVLLKAGCSLVLAPFNVARRPELRASARRGRSGSTATRRGRRAGNSAQRAGGIRRAMPRPPPNCAASRSRSAGRETDDPSRSGRAAPAPPTTRRSGEKKRMGDKMRVERRLVDDLAARDVNQDRVLLHQVQFAGADQSPWWRSSVRR